MELVEVDGQTVVIRLPALELGYLVNCMAEAMQRIDGWEFETLISATPDEISALRSVAAAIRRSVPTEPQT